jgi:hypothetical protein
LEGEFVLFLVRLSCLFIHIFQAATIIMPQAHQIEKLSVDLPDTIISTI